MNSSLKTLKFFWNHWKLHPKLLIGGLMLGPASALQNVVTPLFATLGLNQLIKTGHVNIKIIIFAGVSLALALILDYVLNITFDTMLEHRVEEVMYNNNFDFLLRQDYDFFTNNFGGSLVTRANRLVKAYSMFHLTFFVEMLPLLFTVVFALAIMLHFNLVLGGIITLVWLLCVWIITYLALKRVPLRRLAVSKESIQTGELADAVTNAITIKTFGSEKRELARYAKINKMRGEYFWRSWMKAIRNGWVTNILCGVLQMVIFIVGIIAVEHKTLSLPVFLLFQVYVLRIVDSLRRTNQIVRQLEGVFGDAQEMIDMFDNESRLKDKAGSVKLNITIGTIDFTNVGFSYSEQGNSTSDLFTDFQLRILGSQKIGLVGPSGGGKTTITKLILRFIDIQSGAIQIDGQNIQDVTQQSLREAISYVPQEPLLFHRSIRENIAYGNPDASEAEIIAVAKKAYAHDFITQLPQGYDTLVGERGVKLSGGQRQRVAIARAMLKDAPILVLDEATSALDSESEKVIQQALWELMEGKTAIVIAHRLSTIQKLDRIIVLDEGAVIEDGTHAELLKQKGLYAKLWSHQSGGFIEE